MFFFCNIFDSVSQFCLKGLMIKKTSSVKSSLQYSIAGINLGVKGVGGACKVISNCLHPQ